MAYSIVQLSALTLVTGCNHALFAQGFLTYYRVTKRFDLLFAGYFVIGAYASCLLGMKGIVTALLCAPLFVLGVLALAVIVEKGVYEPIERWSGSSELCLIASLGLYFLVENVIALTFGDAARTARPSMTIGAVFLDKGALRLGTGQIWAAGVSLLFFVIISRLLGTSGFGLLARAAAANDSLATLHGVRLSTAYHTVAGSAAIVSAIAGVAYSLDLEVYPTLGMRTLLVAVAIALASRRATALGVLARALLLSGLEQASGYLFGPRWSDFSTYAVFLGVVAWVGLEERLVTLRKQ